MTIKFYWNGIRVDGKLVKASYSIGPYMPQSGLSDDTITVYAHSCLDHLPHLTGLTVKNDSDCQIDHFENDHMRIPPASMYWKDAKAALDAMDLMTCYGRVKFNTTAEARGLQTAHEMVYIQWQKDDAGQLAKQVVWPAEGKSADAIYPLPH